jgi:hypothetical protein
MDRRHFSYKNTAPGAVCFFLFKFCYVAIAVMYPQEDLAIFDYNLNAKVKIFKTSFYIFGYILEPYIEIWQFFFTF